MTRLRFIGDGDTCTVFGAVFHRNRWTARHGLDDDLVARLAANPTFEADTLDAPCGAGAGGAEPAESPPEP